MTLLDMILDRGLDPFKDEDLLTFINEYWTYNYSIDVNVLAKLKLMFVNTYMYREIQFPELSYTSALSPTMQWKLVLSRYLHEQEDWYVSLYNKLLKLDPYEFTEMVSTTNGESGGTVNNENKSVNNATQNSKVANESTLDSTNNGSVTNESKDHTTSVDDASGTSTGKTTGQQANGIGTIDGGFDPVSVTTGYVVVSDSNMNGTTNENKSTDHNNSSSDSTGNSKTTSEDTGNTKSKGSTTSDGSSEATTTNSGETKSKATSESTTTVKGAVVNKVDLQLKYINAFRNINKEFVDNAWMLFQSTFI